MAEEKLSYTRGVLDKIRASYDKLSREELLDLICYISKTYIVEQTIPFDIPIPEKDEAPPDAEVIDAESAPRTAAPSATQRFASLVEGLKKRTQLPQLEHFSIEDGKVVLVVDNQKVTFGDRVTVEFVPRSGRPASAPAPGPPPAPALPPAPPPPPPPGARKDLPGGDGRMHQAGARPAEPAPPPRPEPRPRPKEAGDLADVDHIVERFKRLDLD